MPFRCIKIPFLREVISPRRCTNQLKCPLLKMNYNHFLGIMNYLRMSSPSIAEVFEPLRKLISSKYESTWNNTYQIYMTGTRIWSEECNYYILEWKGTIIARNRCTGSWHRSKSSASEGQNLVPMEWSTWQCSLVANSVCKQKPDKCWDMLYLWGKHDHRKQTAGSNIHERCSKPIK